MNLFDEVLSGKIPPWLMRIIKTTGRGINRFKMIEEGDRVLIAVSGGKDSIALALFLSLRLKWLPIKYELHALHINWREYPVPEKLLADIHEYFRKIGITFESVDAEISPPSFRGDFNCYLCARNRKRILFDYAEKMGIKKIALGHHMDDIVETTLINLCFRGNFSTMMPVQDFFKGKIQIIRPMCMLKESAVKLAVSRLELPVYITECPHKETNMRKTIRPVINELLKIDRHTVDHIFDAPWNINREYLPTDL